MCLEVMMAGFVTLILLSVIVRSYGGDRVSFFSNPLPGVLAADRPNILAGDMNCVSSVGLYAKIARQIVSPSLVLVN